MVSYGPSDITVSWTKLRPGIFYPAYVTGEQAIYVSTTSWLGEPQELSPPGPGTEGGQNLGSGGDAGEGGRRSPSSPSRSSGTSLA